MGLAPASGLPNLAQGFQSITLFLLMGLTPHQGFRASREGFWSIALSKRVYHSEVAAGRSVATVTATVWLLLVGAEEFCTVLYKSKPHFYVAALICRVLYRITRSGAGAGVPC